MKQMCLPGFEVESPQCEEIVAIIKTKRSIRARWDGRDLVPAGSLIDDLLRSFAAGSSIPLDLPFWTLMHAVSARLCSMYVTLDLGSGNVVEPDLWTIVLAPSGAGKTFTSNKILKSLGGQVPVVPPGAASAAQLFIDIASQPRGLYFQDEFYQMLKQIETVGGPMAEARSIFLKLYDGENITRTTKKDGTIEIKNPRLSLLGLTVTDTFVDGIGSESLVDGFLQRFGICIAKPDAKRLGSDFPLWNVCPDLLKQWDKMFSVVSNGDVYTLSDSALESYKGAFREYFEMLPESFYRRVLWRTFKLALIYQIVTAPTKSKIISKPAMDYAIRATERSIVDSADLLLRSKGGELGKAVESAQRAYDKAVGLGKKFTPRDLLQAVPRLSNASTARFVYQLIDRRPIDPASV